MDKRAIQYALSYSALVRVVFFPSADNDESTFCGQLAEPRLILDRQQAQFDSCVAQ